MKRTNLENPTTNSPEVNAPRRRMLEAIPVIAAAGFLWKPAAAAQNGVGRGSRLAVDVACLGHTLALNFAGAVFDPFNSGDFRGASFLVEGALYPAGTIPAGDGFDPGSASGQMMGHWLCRGWLMFNDDRPAPHAITTQEYLLGVISAGQPSPPDTIVSSGVEGAVQFAHRAIVGGSGQYRNAGGHVVQETTGTNTTTVNVFGIPAPNFRFHFDF